MDKTHIDLDLGNRKKPYYDICNDLKIKYTNKSTIKQLKKMIKAYYDDYNHRDQLDSIYISIDIDDSTSISNKKYNTIGDLKNAPLKSRIGIINAIKDYSKKIYLCKWMFETYYMPKLSSGNLTKRIKCINNMICYNHIIMHCFDGINPLINSMTIPILDNNCTNIIQKLHSINPSGTGVFIDYLIRRIIKEIQQEEFSDTRADNYTFLDNIDVENKHQIWQFNKISESNIGYWNITAQPDICSDIIHKIESGCRFIELGRQDEWLKIKYKDNIGWVRYLLPNIENPFHLSMDNINEYIPNKWFNKIQNDMHYCHFGCKTYTEVINIFTGDYNECMFPLCQNICYMKVKDTKKYKTIDILEELFIVSCCHIEAFNSCYDQCKFNQLLQIINTIDKSQLIEPLVRLCEILSVNTGKILLNPELGSQSTPIPSDCDVVIDDTLFDIKCTKSNNNIYCILQLLGYVSLLKYNINYNIRINNIGIINVLNGNLDIYNIKNIRDDNLLTYMNILMKKYDSSKQINYRTIDNIIEYPIFINKLYNEFSQENI